MAKLYAHASLLVSRYYSHGGDGLEKGPLHFFHSMAEYETLSRLHGWESGKSFGTSWYTRPVPIEAHVEQKAFRKFFAQGGKLPLNKVLFAADKVVEVNAVGGL